MLSDTYLGNITNVKKIKPNATFIIVTRSKGHVLSPSWNTLNKYKDGLIDWNGYTEEFLKEMNNDFCKVEMKKIGESAKTKDIYLVCFEKPDDNCHRFILLEQIKKMIPDLEVISSKSSVKGTLPNPQNILSFP
jgi:hypothetical protein